MPAVAGAGRSSLRARVLVTALSVVYVALALASGVDRIAATNVAKALHVPRALAAESLGLAGDRAIADARYDDALAIAQTAVARAPIEPTSATLLGAAWLGKGDEDRAREAFTVAGRLGWRVPLTQAYWMRSMRATPGSPRSGSMRCSASNPRCSATTNCSRRSKKAPKAAPPWPHGWRCTRHGWVTTSTTTVRPGMTQSSAAHRCC